MLVVSGNRTELSLQHCDWCKGHPHNLVYDQIHYLDGDAVSERIVELRGVRSNTANIEQMKKMRDRGAVHEHAQYTDMIERWLEEERPIGDSEIVRDYLPRPDGSPHKHLSCRSDETRLGVYDLMVVQLAPVAMARGSDGERQGHFQRSSSRVPCGGDACRPSMASPTCVEAPSITEHHRGWNRSRWDATHFCTSD